MVIDYLKKTRDDFLEQRIQLIEQINLCENHLKENIQFVQMLEETNDPNYEAFTPRRVNTFNRKKIEELLKEREDYTNQINDLQKQLLELDCNIDELNSVIKVAKEKMDTPDLLEDTDRNMRMTLLQTIESERQRIARDLHDSITQSITSLVHKTDLCSKLLEVDPIRCKLELFSVNKAIRDIIEEMRKIIYDLRPMSFDDIGFDVTLERSLDKFQNENNIRCNFYTEGEPYLVENVVQITLIRVIQEACSNSVKYADASRIDVTLKYERNSLIVQVADNGKGFDVDAISSGTREDNSGFGISMMRERVYLLSGKLEVKTSPGNGCAIIVTIPITEEET